jgi:excisionase family DNA binding protein
VNASEIMNTKEVAEYLHVHMSTVYRLLKEKSIRGFRVGGDWRFRKESIDAWIKKQEEIANGNDVDAGNSTP